MSTSDRHSKYELKIVQRETNGRTTKAMNRLENVASGSNSSRLETTEYDHVLASIVVNNASCNALFESHACFVVIRAMYNFVAKGFGSGRTKYLVCRNIEHRQGQLCANGLDIECNLMMPILSFDIFWLYMLDRRSEAIPEFESTRMCNTFVRTKLTIDWITFLIFGHSSYDGFECLWGARVWRRLNTSWIHGANGGALNPFYTFSYISRCEFSPAHSKFVTKKWVSWRFARRPKLMANLAQYRYESHRLQQHNIA